MQDTMKNRRQKKILRIIQDFNCESPGDVLEQLKSIGFDTDTQTIAADIKEMRLIKIEKGGECRYYPSNEGLSKIKKQSYGQIVNKAIIEVGTAQNIVLVKTHSGMAQAVAAAIEETDIPTVAGSVAGDDTIIFIAHDNQKALQVKEYLQKHVVDVNFDFKQVMFEAITKVEAAKNTVLVMTYPGTAPATAAAIEEFNIPHMLGCVAGDDTVLIVGKDDDDAKEIVKQIYKLMAAGK